MAYILGDYKYTNGMIYKRVWWFIFECIDIGPHNYKSGVKEVNRLYNNTYKSKAEGVNKLCRDILEVYDWSHLQKINATNNTSGKYRVNFKEPEDFFGNDPLPATVTPYKGRLNIYWENGWDCLIDVSHVNIYELMETDTKQLKG